MRAEDFVLQRRSDWERLTKLLDCARSGLMRTLTDAELTEMGQLYRAATSDLAIAQRDYPRHPVATYLNQLVGRAHATIYRGEPLGWRRAWHFLSAGFPRLYRETAPFILLAFLMFALPGLIAGAIGARDPSIADWLGLQRIADMLHHKDLWTDIPIHERPWASSFIMTNNIRVSFAAFAGGTLAGLLTVYVLILNGLLIGAVLGLSAHYDMFVPLGSFVVGHGVIELSVIFIAGGSGLMLGWAILRPGLLRRRDALAQAARKAVRLIVGGALLLVIAGIIEAFVSPSALPPLIKLGVGLVTGIALYSYLLLAGRNQRSRSDE